MRYIQELIRCVLNAQNLLFRSALILLTMSIHLANKVEWASHHCDITSQYTRPRLRKVRLMEHQ